MRQFLSKILSNKRAVISLASLAVLFFSVPMVTNAWTWAGVAVDFVMSGASFIIEIVVLPLASLILTLTGFIMDRAIDFGLHTNYIFSLSPAVNLGWVIIRDMMNMLFIFILIYISIGTIIRGTGFGTKKLLTQVIIAAILINFSLFITKAVVDVSNIFGNWLYGGIQQTLKVNSTNQTNPTSLAGLISTRLGITTLWSKGATNNTNSANSFNDFGSGTVIISAMIRLIVVCITIYIFMYCAVLFISRSVTILFLLVFSPLGFMGGVLPQIKKYSGQWRDELLSAAIFPVAFLVMLYISLQFINSLKYLNSEQVSDTVFLGVSVTKYFQYFLIIFLLKGSLKVAKENSGEMGKALGGMASSLGQLAVGAVTTGGIGAVAWAGRRTIGSVASKISNNDTLNDMASGKYGLAAQLMGKAGLGTARATAGSSLDPRGLKITQNLAKSAGIDLGQAQKGGFTGMQKEREKAEKEYAEKFGKDEKGIERRKTYAESVKNSIIGKIRSGGFTSAKLGTNLTEKERTTTAGKVADAIGKDTEALERKNKADAAKKAKKGNKIKLDALDKELETIKGNKTKIEAELEEINKKGTVGGVAMDRGSLEKIRVEKENQLKLLSAAITGKEGTLKELKESVDLAEETEARETIAEIAKEVTEAEKPTKTEPPAAPSAENK